jgi:8-oxo-dGTP pyrophosphatase MutT (NUDIX family)
MGAVTPEELAPIFAAELDRLTPLVDQVEHWSISRMRMRTFVGDVAWPEALATSARAVVFKGSRVVVVRQTTGERHIRPGGRIEPGETFEQTARREVLEETGWELGSLTPFGFQYFQHLDPRPAGASYRWCDFVQPVFVAEATRYRRSARDLSQVEAGSRLTSYRQALATAPSDAALLRAALAKRRDLGG